MKNIIIGLSVVITISAQLVGASDVQSAQLVDATDANFGLTRAPLNAALAAIERPLYHSPFDQDHAATTQIFTDANFELTLTPVSVALAALRGLQDHSLFARDDAVTKSFLNTFKNTFDIDAFLGSKRVSDFATTVTRTFDTEILKACITPPKLTVPDIKWKELFKTVNSSNAGVFDAIAMDLVTVKPVIQSCPTVRISKGKASRYDDHTIKMIRRGKKEEKQKDRQRKNERKAKTAARQLWDSAE